MIHRIKNDYPSQKIHTLPLKARDLVAAGLSRVTRASQEPFHSFYRTPKLTNTKINFEASDIEQSMTKTLEQIKVSGTSNLNLQVKAGHNTIYNLQPALIFAEHTRNLYPNIPITISIRLDDNNGDLAENNQSQLQQKFEEKLLQQLLKRTFLNKSESEINSLKVEFINDLNKAQKKGIQLKFIPQQASNSTYESFQALINDFDKQMKYTHFIEFTQNAALQNRSNIGISAALKERRKGGRSIYPNITVINTLNFKSWCPIRDSALEQFSELYDTSLYCATGKIRDPNSPSGFLSRIKYGLTEGKTK